MEFTQVEKGRWKEIKEIYMEAFPKAERKPFFLLKRAVKKEKMQLLAAVEEGRLLGFAALIPCEDMVMVDYLAVSQQIRSRGTGSRLMQEVGRRFWDKKIVLLIEKLDDRAANSEQRLARRAFYLKNGYSSSGIYMRGVSGEMEVMNRGGRVSKEEYLKLQKYALGGLLFRLSGIEIAA